MPELPGRALMNGRALDPTEIGSHHFPTVRRGLDADAVRRFLLEVADQVRESRRVEEALRAELDQVRAERPAERDDATLASTVGAETSRVLQVAHDAARDIVAASEHRAAALVADGEAALADRARAAEAAADHLLEKAKADAAVVVESTRNECRQMVDEAIEARRRILEDLVARRHALHAQLAQLRAGKDALGELIESVSTSVVASVASVREQLEGAEEHASAAASNADIETTPEEELELESLLGDPKVERLSAVFGEFTPLVETFEGSSVTVDFAVDSDAEGIVRIGPAAPKVEVAPDDRSHGLEELFARIRAERPTDDLPPEPATGPAAQPERGSSVAEQGSSVAAQAAPTVAAPTAAASVTRLPPATPVDEPAPEATATPVAVPELVAVPAAPVAARDDVAVVEEGSPSATDEPAVAGEAPLLAQRDKLLGPALSELSRSLKRQLRVEENELLDAFRNLAREADHEALLPASAMTGRIVDASMAPLHAAWRAGEDFVVARLGAGDAEPAGGGSDAEVREMATRLAEQIVDPIRRRIVASIDEQAGAGDRSSAIGVVFRDWRGVRVDGLAGDFALDAFTAGIVKASMACGCALVWIADDGGTTCPDCDDNAIGGSVAAGDAFPTGHRHPPVHPGCRCILVPAAE